MPNCAAKTRPPSLYVPGPGFSPGPPTASPGMTIGRSAPLLCIGVSLSRDASKRGPVLEDVGLLNPHPPGRKASALHGFGRASVEEVLKFPDGRQGTDPGPLAWRRSQRFETLMARFSLRTRGFDRLAR